MLSKKKSKNLSFDEGKELYFKILISEYIFNTIALYQAAGKCIIVSHLATKLGIEDDSLIDLLDEQVVKEHLGMTYVHRVPHAVFITDRIIKKRYKLD